jgi:hypothetical protein
MTEYQQRQYNRGYLNGYEQAMGFDHARVDNETEDTAYLSGTRDGRQAAIDSCPWCAEPVDPTDGFFCYQCKP